MLRMTTYALIAALILLLLDELMPKQAGSRPIKALPSLLRMVGLCVLSVASFPLMAHGGLMPAQGQAFTTASTLLVYSVAQLMAIIFFALAGCQLFLERSSSQRLLSFLIAGLIATKLLLPMLGVDEILALNLKTEPDPAQLHHALMAGKIQAGALLVLVLTWCFGPLRWRQKPQLEAGDASTSCLSSAPSRQSKGRKKLQDYLPASLVLDMRQFLRTPLYILAAWVVIVWIYIEFWVPQRDSITATMLANIGLLCIIALRASNKVAGDIREGGSNFLQLCPLPAWRIVAGQWGSAAIQMLALSLLLLPLYLHHAHPLPVDDLYDSKMESYLRHCATAPYLMALLSFLAGMLLCAGAMVLACLPVLFRAMALAITTAFIFGCNIDWVMDLPFSRETGWIADVSLANSLVVFAAIQALLFSAILLLLCSRYYSSRVEDARNAAWVKRLSWLSMLLGVAMFIGLRCSLGSEAFIRIDEYNPKLWPKMGYCFLPYLVIYLSDELLPREGLSASRSKLMHMLLMMVVFIGSTLGLAWLTQGWSAASTPPSNQQIIDMCYYPLALVGSFCLPLGFAKLLHSNSSRYQILTYGIATCLIAIVCIESDYGPFGCCTVRASDGIGTERFAIVLLGTLISLGFIWAAPKLNPREQ